MDASVFYTRLPCCTLRSWNCCCVSGVFTYFYLQLWNCRGLASPGFTPCLSCVGSHSPTPRLYNPAAVVTVEPSSCQTFPTPACDTMNRQPSLGSGTVHARRGALGACVSPTQLSVAATVARVTAANISTTWRLFFFVFVLIIILFVFSNPPIHAPVPHHKVSVTLHLTYPGSSSCKSLLASHCAVSQSNVSSSDCAINTSEWLLPFCSINMRTLV